MLGRRNCAPTVFVRKKSIPKSLNVYTSTTNHYRKYLLLRYLKACSDQSRIALLHYNIISRIIQTLDYILSKISFALILLTVVCLFVFFSQSILKVNGSCDKSRNAIVSFSNVESEVIGYGGEEYSTDDEEYSTDEESHTTECGDSGDDEELKRLTEANTNLNSKVILHEKLACDNDAQLRPKSTAAADNNKAPSPSAEPVAAQLPSKTSPPLVTVQPFCGESSKSLVFNFLKNKEIAAAVAAAAKETRPSTTCAGDKNDTIVAATTADHIVADSRNGNAVDEVQLRKTETTKRPALTRSSLVANSNEPYLNIKRCSLQPAAEDAVKPPPAPPLNSEIPIVKLHPPETVKAAAAVVENPAGENEVAVSTKELAADGAGDTAAGVAASYKTRSNVPRMGTMHFKLKLAVATSQKPEPLKSTADSTPESSLTSREMAGEPDGKADSDEPGEPTIAPANRSFLHNFKNGSPPRTPSKKVSQYYSVLYFLYVCNYYL